MGLKIILVLTASSQRNLGKDEEIELQCWRAKIIIIESNMGKGRHGSGVPEGQNRELELSKKNGVFEKEFSSFELEGAVVCS